MLSANALFGAPFGTAAPISEFTAPDTAFLERSDIGGVLVSSAVGAPAVSARLGDVTGVPLPLEPGAFTGTTSYRGIWLTPGSWILQCPVDEEERLVTRINTAFPDKRAHAAHFTDYLCWFELRGPWTTALLQEGAFLSFEQRGIPVGQAKRTVFAGIPVVFVREGVERWVFAVERSRGIYLADWLRAAARRCAGIQRATKGHS
jgi:heterotetrameric sarcosine oxidase gamma subunit